MKKLFALAFISALAFGSANAGVPTNQDSAVDKYGKHIVDARNNCVYTKWDGKGDCAAISNDWLKVYFDFNSSALKGTERSKLDKLAAAIKKAKSVESATIVGYADRVGGDGYNKALSQRRANAVRRYLAGKGVKVKNVDLRAKGETEPATACSDSMKKADLVACLQEDRRVEIELNYKK